MDAIRSLPTSLSTLDDSVLRIILKHLGLYSIVRFCNTCRLLAHRRPALLAALPEATRIRLAETLFMGLRKSEVREVRPTAVPPRVFVDVVSVLAYDVESAAGEQVARSSAVADWLAGKPPPSLRVPQRRLVVVTSAVTTLNVPLIEAALAWAQDMPLASAGQSRADGAGYARRAWG
jgi:hypothetical protein